jgi:tetratricopeptide (TPR) repeat protein
MGTAFAAMGRLYRSQHRYGEAENVLKESIGLLKDSLSYRHTLMNTYTSLGMNYIQMKRYGDALKTAAEQEKQIILWEASSVGQHPEAWWQLYTVYANTHRLSGKYDEAEIYLDKLDSISNGAVKSYDERAHILMGRGHYTEALEMVEKAIENNPAATKAQAIRVKMEIQMRMGRVEDALETLDGYMESVDSMHSEEVNTQLDKIRTRYEVDRHIAEKQPEDHAEKPRTRPQSPAMGKRRNGSGNNGHRTCRN